MNHLKLYENFGDFKEMSHDNFFKLLLSKKEKTANGMLSDDEVVEFSKADIFEISKILNGYVYITTHISQASISKDALLNIHKRKGKDKIGRPTYEDSPSFKVMKLSDDWFLLIDMQRSRLETRSYVDQKYYKCDQIYGVVDCLKSITITNEGFNFFNKKKKLKEEEPLYRQTNYTNVQEYVESHEKDYITKPEFRTLYNVSKIKYNDQWRSEGPHRFGTQIDFSYKRKYYTMTKFEDEWFILRKMGESSEWRQGTSTYYICDTIDGVVNCIKNEI